LQPVGRRLPLFVTYALPTGEDLNMVRRMTRPDGAAGDDNFQFPEEPAVQEAWLGRLRYVVVPVLAVLAIVTAIYLLQGGNGSAVDAVNQPGASNPVNVGAPSGSAAKVPAPRVGHPAPDFTLTSLDRQPAKLSDYRGKTVFLNFFATWCPPCRAEMPDIMATYEQNKDNDVVVLLVNMQEEPGVVSNYASSVGLPFPIVLDRSGYVSSMYRITAIPSSFFIDKDGVVQAMQIGAMSKDLMESRLQKAL
jgi:peroxiredoxin